MIIDYNIGDHGRAPEVPRLLLRAAEGADSALRIYLTIIMNKLIIDRFPLHNLLKAESTSA